ncbi:WPP domain-containing protein 2-like [Euphorbia lathyris]|uniref:WPP domain-containing protein 2-like n=1 Tax=Euphorbia lathyris TaxID=212925 RepID=UPI0033134CC7
MTDSDAGSGLSHDQDSAPLDSNPLQQDSKKQSGSGISLSIWPPSQRTRDAVINRLIETLSSPSVLSKRYGTISHDDAEVAARRIEEEAFDVANRAQSTTEDDGLEILQHYSKEISKRMLETVKALPKSDSAVNNGAPGTPNPDAAPTEASGAEVSSSVEADA